MISTTSPIARYALVAAFGAAGMYWFDPAQGGRRRALARDKLVSSLTATSHAAGALGRDARHRAKGVAARTHPLIRANDVSDEVLVERVRSALGRATSHPGAIDVSSSQGVVTLQGAVLKHEHPRVMRAVRSAAGASEVHDELAAYKRPDGIPALQGGRSLPKQNFSDLHENWSSRARLLACVSGASLALWGMRQHPVIALLASGAGSALFVRGASNMTPPKGASNGAMKTRELKVEGDQPRS